MPKTRVLLAFAVLLALGGCGSHAVSKKGHVPPWPAWTVPSFGVTLRHPKGWQPAAGYLERLQGKDGYVALNALQGSGLTPQAAAKSQAQQPLSAFGPNPVLKAMKVDGQPGYLIMPSQARTGGQVNEAEAIVLYPKPETISGVPYRYLVITSTPKDILPIVRSLRFSARHG